MATLAPHLSSLGKNQPPDSDDVRRETNDEYSSKTPGGIELPKTKGSFIGLNKALYGSPRSEHGKQSCLYLQVQERLHTASSWDRLVLVFTTNDPKTTRGAVKYVLSHFAFAKTHRFPRVLSPASSHAIDEREKVRCFLQRGPTRKEERGKATRRGEGG